MYRSEKVVEQAGNTTFRQKKKKPQRYKSTLILYRSKVRRGENRVLCRESPRQTPGWMICWGDPQDSAWSHTHSYDDSESVGNAIIRGERHGGHSTGNQAELPKPSHTGLSTHGEYHPQERSLRLVLRHTLTSMYQTPSPWEGKQIFSTNHIVCINSSGTVSQANQGGPVAHAFVRMAVSGLS